MRLSKVNDPANNLTDAPSSLPPNFAAISLPNPFRRRPKPKPKPEEPVEPGHYEQLARQVLWECENLPDHRHTPEVDKILADNDAAFGGNNDDSVFVLREDATEEEVRENAELVERLRSSPVVQFMARVDARGSGCVLARGRTGLLQPPHDRRSR